MELDPETLTPDLETLDRLIGPRTKLVAVTHPSNILGTINPVAEVVIERMSHQVAVMKGGTFVEHGPRRAMFETPQGELHARADWGGSEPCVIDPDRHHEIERRIDVRIEYG